MKRWILRLLKTSELCMSAAPCESKSLSSRDRPRQNRGSRDDQKGKQGEASQRKKHKGSSKYKKRMQNRDGAEADAEYSQKHRMIRGAQSKAEIKHNSMIRSCEDRRRMEEIKHRMERQRQRQKQKKKKNRGLDSEAEPIWKRRNFKEPMPLFLHF